MCALLCHCLPYSQGAIIANPNCSTIIALMAVTPLHRLATVKRMVVSTYQAASGEVL
jgi:aspartate-semialdehyde dehydrogenase